jgi:hypothetical protein
MANDYKGPRSYRVTYQIRYPQSTKVHLAWKNTLAVSESEAVGKICIDLLGKKFEIIGLHVEELGNLVVDTSPCECCGEYPCNKDICPDIMKCCPGCY